MVEREIYRRRNLFSAWILRLDLFANGIHRRRGEKILGADTRTLAHPAQQQVLGGDFMAAELAGFVARHKYYAARLFRVSLEHTWWVGAKVSSSMLRDQAVL